MTNRINSIAVLGGGIAAYAAACAFRRALPKSEVTVIAEASEPEYPGASAPFIHAFHRLIGIEEAQFFSRTGATTVHEVEFRQGRGETRRLVPLAQIPHFEGSALHQLWLRAAREWPDETPAWRDVALRARRPEDRALGWGVRFDDEGYLALLRALAGHLKVQTRHSDGPDCGAFDLIVDTRAGTERGENWLHLDGLPGEIAWRPEENAPPQPSEFETVAAENGGFLWANANWRLRGVAAEKGAVAGADMRPWAGNVLRIGRAAWQGETFDGHPLALALLGIARAIELLPRPASSGREQAEYNRRMGHVHALLLDWAAERWGVGLRPPGLQALRLQFDHRGRIPFRDEDPVPEGHWIGWLLAQGERPANVDLTARAVPESSLRGLFSGF